MGVNKTTIRVLREAMSHAVSRRLKLALIGDLYMRGPGYKYRRANTFFRETWKEVLSFDINGNADIKVDLSEPIDTKYHYYFDVLINGGTAEHVDDQKVFFDNCHDMVKPSGVILHVAPEQGSFPDHSEYYYTETFFVDYADKYDYQILSIERIKHRQGWAIYTALKKRK